LRTEVKCAYCNKIFEIPAHRMRLVVKNICCTNECRYSLQKKPNEIVSHESHAEIITKKGNIIIDLKDIEKVSGFTWYINNSGYASSCIQLGRKNKKPISKYILLHRFLLNVQENDKHLVDHINRNPLDNRVNNLRIADNTLNCINTNKYKNNKTGQKGVYFGKTEGTYTANIRVRNKTYYLGTFNDFESAKVARITAEDKYHRPILEGK